MTAVANAPLVVIGASLAGLRAVQAARASGYTGRVILIGSERHVPYDRPPLSKQFLLPGTSPDFLTAEEELRNELDVEVRLSSTATSLDSQAHVVTVNGEPVTYGRLIVATGAGPRTLPNVPALRGVVTLRTLDDAKSLREHITPGKRIVVIGAGFIGSEIASSAKASGADVIILEAAPAPLKRALGEVVGQVVSRLHARNDVQLHLSARIEGLEGKEAVSGVRLTGGTIIPADIVVVGIGAAPATSWLIGSGVELSPLDGGIVCDAQLRTSVPDVYAAGDVVHWPNSIMDSTMRLENWTNAADQGRHAAQNAVSPETAKPYFTVPYFWSDWYGQRLQVVGKAECDEVVLVSGHEDSDRWVALYRAGERLIGAATLNEPRRIMKYRRVIAERISWNDARALFPSD
ncbi:NAD(P)/FAD-dependent oxidoreductase [Paraburkholderia sediminicola]|nr:FAD-dependent oxidoreductase [Paraburkholderia sediminicola]